MAVIKEDSAALDYERIAGFVNFLSRSRFVLSYDLRGNCILSLSKPKTTTYGLNSSSYFSAKQWNALPDFFRTSFFADFKTKIQDVTFM